MHKFAKQTHVWIFCHERTRSTPLDPNLMFWGRFGTFHCCTKVDAKLAEQVPLLHKFAKQTHVRIFRYERTRSTPLDPTLMFWERLGPFRYCTKLDNKLNELAPSTHKFTKRSSVGTFRIKRTWSTPLDLKLMFWRILDRFVTGQNMMLNWLN
jgi:hypothetical protein